ncbi:MAG TPA: hypothetical protein VNA30_06665 [Mycobacteriales bacterium]|nr:hypothetical protein [Mycobacteriales bacterium]
MNRVIVYSDDPAVRNDVRRGIGIDPGGSLSAIEWVDCGTGAEVISDIDTGGVDLVILDGEAWPTGGMGLARQLKDEIDDCPPTLLLIARRDDAWLAKWSLADAVVPFPLDTAVLAGAVTELLHGREQGLPVRRHVRFE